MALFVLIIISPCGIWSHSKARMKQPFPSSYGKVHVKNKTGANKRSLLSLSVVRQEKILLFFYALSLKHYILKLNKNGLFGKSF